MAELTFYTREMAALADSYVKKGYWQDRSFIDYWEENARLYPDKEALVDSRKRLTWSQVKERVDRIAFRFLELGLKRDASIAVLLPWSVESCLTRAAHQKAGLVLTEIAPTLRHEELRHILKTVDVNMVITPWKHRDFNYFQMIEELRPDLPGLTYVVVTGDHVPAGAISFEELMNRPLEEPLPPDYFSPTRYSPFELSFLWHTSGSTGLPKLCANNESMLLWGGRVHQYETGEKLTSEDVCGIICPAIAGPNVLPFYGGCTVGAKLVMLEVFRPEEALRLIEKERITIFSSVPTQLQMMLNIPHFEKYDLSSLRFIICTGASLAYELALTAEQKFGCPIIQHYGSQEHGVVTVAQHYTEPREQRLRTVGRPSVDEEVKIVDESGREVAQGQEGEIMGRGPLCTFGYYKDPEATRNVWTDDGWYRMGDLGRFDEQGNLMIVGRAKEMIIRGGQNIYPVEIEGFLLTHPKILNAAVVSMPDPLMGEKLCAYVVPKAGQEITFDQMVSFLKEKRIASFKLPERLEILNEFPTVAGGKTDKKFLRQDIAKKLEAEAKMRTGKADGKV